MSDTPINSPCHKQRKLSTRSPKTPVKKVQKSSSDNFCLICGINFKLSGQGSFFNTNTTAGLKENLTVLLGESPEFSFSSRRLCKCCKRKVDSVIKRTSILEQDKAFLINKYRKNNSTSARQCAKETAELSPPRYKRMCKESPLAENKQAKSRKALYKEKDGVEELGVCPLNTSFEDLESAEFVSHDHSYANKLTSEPDTIAQYEGDFPPEVKQPRQQIAANKCDGNCQTGVEERRERIAANQFEGDFQTGIEQPQEPDVANQCVELVDLPQSFLALLSGDDFHFDFASSSAYDQDGSKEVSVDAEITGNAQEDEVEVEVTENYISIINFSIVGCTFLRVRAPK